MLRLNSRNLKVRYSKKKKMPYCFNVYFQELIALNNYINGLTDELSLLVLCGNFLPWPLFIIPIWQLRLLSNYYWAVPFVGLSDLYFHSPQSVFLQSLRHLFVSAAPLWQKRHLFVFTEFVQSAFARLWKQRISGFVIRRSLLYTARCNI